MSKLYLSARTDAIREPRTARATKYIDVNFHFDERDFARKINVRMNIPEETNKPTIWFQGEKLCEIEMDKGEMVCKIDKKFEKV